MIEKKSFGTCAYSVYFQVHKLEIAYATDAPRVVISRLNYFFLGVLIVNDVLTIL